MAGRRLTVLRRVLGNLLFRIRRISGNEQDG
jgi:hypothetical protein